MPRRDAAANSLSADDYRIKISDERGRSFFSVNIQQWIPYVFNTFGVISVGQRLIYVSHVGSLISTFDLSAYNFGVKI